MRAFIIVSVLTLMSACNQVHPFSEEERAQIDCLAAITVVEITDEIRAGTEAGMDANVLAETRPEKIAKAIEQLEAEFPGRMDEAYLEYDINNQLGKIECAIESGDPMSVENLIMTETLELGRTCTFGGDE